MTEATILLGREIRNLQHLKRWQIIRTVRERSVADHSLMVAILADRLVDWLYDQNLQLPNFSRSELTLRVLRGAMYHDVGEILSGDVAHPAKTAYRLVRGAKDAYKDWEADRLEERFPWLKEETNSSVRAIIGLCDLFESYLALQDEERLGNKEVGPVMAHVWEKLATSVVDHFKREIGVDPTAFLRQVVHENGRFDQVVVEA